MSSKIEYEMGTKSADLVTEGIVYGYDVVKATMTTTKDNGDELIVAFGHNSGVSHDDISDTICAWSHPNVTVLYRHKKEQTEVMPQRKFFGIFVGSPKVQTREVVEDQILYQEDIYFNKPGVKKKSLDDLLREFEKTNDSSVMLKSVNPEFKPVISKALEAMKVGGLSDTLDQKRQAEAKVKEALKNKHQMRQVQIHNNAALANSFLVR